MAWDLHLLAHALARPVVAADLLPLLRACLDKPTAGAASALLLAARDAYAAIGN